MDIRTRFLFTGGKPVGGPMITLFYFWAGSDFRPSRQVVSFHRFGYFPPVGLMTCHKGISLYFWPIGEKDHFGILGLIIYFLG